MKRIFVFLIAALASIGIAFAQAPAKDAKKPEATKDVKADAKKPDAPAKADAKKPDAPAKADAKKVELMDINMASEKDLATLPGIGEARAKAIVKGRPYKGKDELVEKKVIPQNVYVEIKDKIIAKQK